MNDVLCDEDDEFDEIVQIIVKGIEAENKQIANRATTNAKLPNHNNQKESIHQTQTNTLKEERAITEEDDEKLSRQEQLKTGYPLYLGSTVPQQVTMSFEGKARGNIYVSPSILNKMVSAYSGDFIIDPSDDQTNHNFAYNYFNESVGMQCNDNQIKVFDISTKSGVYILIANIDVLDPHRNVLYVVATQNTDFRYQAKWNVSDFKTATQISNEYHIAPWRLPASSRSFLEKELGCAEREHIPFQIVNEAGYKQLAMKVTNRLKDTSAIDSLSNKQTKQTLIRRAKKKKIKEIRQMIDADTFRMSCRRSWNESLPFLPVIVVKNNKHWIEYKKYIKLHGVSGWKDKHFAISIRFIQNKWKICCIDTNTELIYYQHRLIGSQSKHLKTYKELLRFPMIDEQ